MTRYGFHPSAIALLLLSGSVSGAMAAETALPASIAAPGETTVLTVHAAGQQIYDCKAGADGKLAWAFREPAASLTVDNKPVGRHFAGPSWELTDGSSVVGKVIGNAPGTGPDDVAWLKLDVASHKGSGKLSDVDMVQRINTVGGKLDGACEQAGTTRAVPYTADYLFLRKG